MLGPTYTVKTIMAETLAPSAGTPWEFDTYTRQYANVDTADVLRKRDRMKTYAQDNAIPGTFATSQTSGHLWDRTNGRYRFAVQWTDSRDGSRNVWTQYAMEAGR